MQNHDSLVSGRTALRSAAAGLLVVKPNTAFGSQANSSPELALIGCGSRGGNRAPKSKPLTVPRFCRIWRTSHSKSGSGFSGTR